MTSSLFILMSNRWLECIFLIYLLIPKFIATSPLEDKHIHDFER